MTPRLIPRSAAFCRGVLDGHGGVRVDVRILPVVETVGLRSQFTCLRQIL